MSTDIAEAWAENNAPELLLGSVTFILSHPVLQLAWHIARSSCAFGP